MNNLITDLDAIKKLAAEKFNDFDTLQYQLQIHDDVTDAEVDAFVTSIAAPIIDAIDCTACANCCRHLEVYLTARDVQRLASGLGQPVTVIDDVYIDHDAATREGEWGMFKRSPCAFLQGKLCSVYEHRPESCRIYPVFTPDFRWTMTDIIAGAGMCPIIYNVLVALVDCVDELYDVD